jgi:hypothetical protein
MKVLRLIVLSRRPSYSSRSIPWRRQQQSKPDTDVNLEPLRDAHVHYGSLE